MIQNALRLLNDKPTANMKNDQIVEDIDILVYSTHL